MALTQYEDDYRNQIADQLTPPVKPNTPLSTAMSAIPQNLGKQFTTGMPAGMPQTPAGGVPGSGMAPAAPSTVQLPQGPPPGMRGAMSSMNAQSGPPPPQLGGLGQPLGMPQQLPPTLPDVPAQMPEGAPYGLSQAPGLAQAAGLSRAPARGMRRMRGY